MLLIVRSTYEKQELKDKGKEVEKRSKGLLALLGVKDSEPLKLSLIRKGMRDQIITMPTWAASLPRTLLPLSLYSPWSMESAAGASLGFQDFQGCAIRAIPCHLAHAPGG